MAGTEGAVRTRTIAEINERLRRGEAVVLTALELKEEVRRGRRVGVEDVDVVTTGSRGPMSGTAAAFSFPVAGRRETRGATRVWMNGVPAFPDGAPGEGEDAIDVVVYGTAPSRQEPRRYGGGHLFRDVLEGRPIHVEILAEGSRPIRRVVTVDDFNFARLYNVRNTFRNYMAFANFKGNAPLETIFGFRSMGPETGVTVVGSGEMNPLQNDPELRVIRVGSRVLVNGAPGIVVGAGTRSSPARPNLSLVADMFEMDPAYMGGFITDGGVEVITAIAVPIPILDETTLHGVLEARDETIPLPVADISDRLPFTETTYAEVWQGPDLQIRYDPAKCVTCSFACVAEHYCPVGAISWRDQRHDDNACVACGACTVSCVGGAFTAELGQLTVDGRKVPITFRQSDRRRGVKIAELLRDRMRRGEFLLSDLGERIEHRSPAH